METITVEFIDEASGLKATKIINVKDCATEAEVDARIEEHRKTFKYRLSLGLITPTQEIKPPIPPKKD